MESQSLLRANVNIRKKIFGLAAKLAMAILVLSVLFLPFSFGVPQAQAATALTAYQTNTSATTLSNASQLSSSAPASEVSTITVKVGKSTGWDTLPSKGTTNNWAAGASEPSQLGTGFLWDVTTLEGQQIVAGNWTPKVKLKVSAGSVVADIHVRASVYHSSNGTYTTIIDAVSTGKTINTTATVYTLPATAGALTDFTTGDKIYQDVILNITSNSTGSSTAKFTIYENGGANESLATPGYQSQPTTTLGDGTNPGNATLAPGAAITDLDAFTLTTSTGSDTITALTVTLSDNTGIAQLDITNSSNVAQCTPVTNPASTTVNFSGCSLAAGTSPTTYKVRLTPQSATAMPAVPGGTYVITGTVSAFTGSNLTAGSDSGSATLTIDNASPADVSNATTTPADGQITLNWTNPTATDFSQIVILRATSTISSAPTEGASYSAGNNISSALVVYAGSATTYSDSPLSNGTTYYYKIFAEDASGNYSTPGVAVSDTPVQQFSLSGHVFKSDGATPLLAADTVTLAVASSTNYSTTTVAADGSFYFSAFTQPASGTVITLWLNTNGGDQGSTVFKYGSGCVNYPSCSDLKIYRDYVRINSFNGASVSNADLSSCDADSGSACSDTDIGFTSNGGSLTVTFPKANLRVAPNTTFAPGGNVSASKLTVAGTYTGGTETLILSGSGQSYNCSSDQAMPLCVLGTFTPTSNTVKFTGNASTTVPGLSYYNLSLAPTSTPVYSLGGGNWYASGGNWSYRKVISINHNKVASSTGEVYTDFPLLIDSGADSDLAAHAQSSGNDIVFTAADGTTKLDHEVEKYNSANGDLIAWVRLPSLSTSTDTTLYMYYGNASAAAQSNKTAVWNSSYALVAHYPDGTTLSGSDSTQNAAAATLNLATAAAGQIDGAASFSSTKITYPDSAALNPTSALTISAWFKKTATGTNQSLVFKGDGSTNSNSAYDLVFNSSDQLRFEVSSTTWQTAQDPAAVSDSLWHYAVGTYNGSAVSLYVDGVFVASSTASSAINNDNNSLAVGGNAVGGPNYYGGLVDELRVSNTSRSADWISTEYNNQNSTSTFYTVSAQVTAAQNINNNLTVGDGSNAVTMTATNRPLWVGGNLLVSSGATDFNANNPTVTVGGSLTNNGSFSAPRANLTLAGNFTNNGTFSHNNGTVILAPAAAAQIAGSTTFYNMTSTSSGATLQFQAQSAGAPVFNFVGQLSLFGGSGNNLSVQSTSVGTQWLANFSGSQPGLVNVNFTDAGCTASSTAVNLVSSVVNGGNNGSCWIFFVGSGGGTGGAAAVSATPSTGLGSGGGTLVSGGGTGGDGTGGSTDSTGLGSGGGTTTTGGGSGGGSGGGGAPAAAP
ncbi:MAG: DUF2341 domain-containing protein [Patescibacteria group bacterium]|nr:DUF2341 domain-containing protein [Patescibacteria group bacterium]